MMKSLAFAILIVVGMASWTVAQADPVVKCTREGLMCLDCKTLTYCKKTEHTSMTFTQSWTEKCVVGFVCDEWNLQCVRNGTCRYKPFSCPTINDNVVPDPYSCTGFFGCSDGTVYQCKDDLVYRNNTCMAYDGSERCYDYPVLCEKADQTVELDGFKYVCKEETIDGKHTIHPVLVL